MDSTEGRFDRLELMVTSLIQQLRDTRQRAEGQFAKMAEEHALDVVATDARMDRLSGIINEHERRLDAVEEARAWIDTFEVKKFADVINERLDQQGEAIDQINERVESGRRGLIYRLDFLDRWQRATQARADGADLQPVRRPESITDISHTMSAPGGRQTYETEKNKISKAMLDQVRVQPTIKGGWANVEGNDPGQNPIIIGTFKTRAEADRNALSSRIACIRIPDFTEGEGL